MPHEESHQFPADHTIRRDLGKSESSSHFQKFIRGFFQLIGSQQHESNLNLHHEKIVELKRTGNILLTELISLKEELQVSIEDKILCEHVEAVMDPILKKLSQHQETPLSEHHIQHIASFEAWISKAKSLVDFFSNAPQREAVVNEVIKHAISTVHDKIDRDLQVIQDYVNHNLANQSLNEEIKETIKERINIMLQPLLQALIDLKVVQSELPLEKLSDWKLSIDKQRSNYYNEAFHRIDAIMEEYELPHSESDEETEHLQKDFEKMLFLETVAPQLVLAMQQNPSEKERKVLKAKLYSLETEANNLEQDLHLAPELEERLEHVKSIFNKAKRLLP